MRSLGFFLKQLEKKYHRRDYLFSDPLQFAHRYRDPWDQEAVAILAALLAYGNVKQINRSVETVLEGIHSISSSPRHFVQSLTQASKRRQAERVFSNFVHRFNRGSDLVLLFRLVAESWKRYGSVGEEFLEGASESESIEAPLIQMMEKWKSKVGQWSGQSAVSESFYFLLTSPVQGSACKRWCMYLRWMGRKDDLDLGLWNSGSALVKSRFLSPGQLILPVDTHTGRISQYLGLTSRKSLDWKFATEVTRRLREVHSTDPTRYDFALSRLGILDQCQKRLDLKICRQCTLFSVCRFSQKTVSLGLEGQVQ